MEGRYSSDSQLVHPPSELITETKYCGHVLNCLATTLANVVREEEYQTSNFIILIVWDHVTV